MDGIFADADTKKLIACLRAGGGHHHPHQNNYLIGSSVVVISSPLALALQASDLSCTGSNPVTSGECMSCGRFDVPCP